MMLLSLLLPLTHWYEFQDIMVLRSISDNLDMFYPFTECMQCAWILWPHLKQQLQFSHSNACINLVCQFVVTTVCHGPVCLIVSLLWVTIVFCKIVIVIFMSSYRFTMVFYNNYHHSYTNTTSILHYHFVSSPHKNTVIT